MARSLLFNVLFYVTTTLFVVIGSPLLFAPRRWAMAALAVHGRFELWLLKTIVGTGLEVRGQEKLPEGPCLVASKHQSAWETFALIPLFRDPALLMKRELFWIPFHGWFSKKFEMIPVDREKGSAALRAMSPLIAERLAIPAALRVGLQPEMRDHLVRRQRFGHCLEAVLAAPELAENLIERTAFHVTSGSLPAKPLFTQFGVS